MQVFRSNVLKMQQKFPYVGKIVSQAGNKISPSKEIFFPPIEKGERLTIFGIFMQIFISSAYFISRGVKRGFMRFAQGVISFA